MLAVKLKTYLIVLSSIWRTGDRHSARVLTFGVTAPSSELREPAFCIGKSSVRAFRPVSANRFLRVFDCCDRPAWTALSTVSCRRTTEPWRHCTQRSEGFKMTPIYAARYCMYNCTWLINSKHSQIVFRPFVGSMATRDTLCTTP